MSNFKRPYKFSPRRLYKSLSTKTLLNVSSTVRNALDDDNVESPIQGSGLHLCRGASVAYDSIKIVRKARENSSLKCASGNKKVAASTCEEDSPRSCVIEYSDTGNVASLTIPEEMSISFRGPRGLLHANTSAKSSRKPAKSDDKKDEEALLSVPPSHPLHVWDEESSCDAAPVSSWSALGNRYLLCRPLPLDVGRCACYIVREREAGGDGPIVYSLYTDEGRGRQDRKLAVARHRRKAGRSEFIIGLNGDATILAKRSESFLGRVSANIIGSRYCIWDELSSSGCKYQGCRHLLGVVMFQPTIATLTGTFKVMRAYVPKFQSVLMNNTSAQIDPIGLPRDWQQNTRTAHELCSRKPVYNKLTKRYELDYRDRTRVGHRIQTSSKNFQLVMEEHGKQAILLLGKVGKSKYIMEYCFPLTAYQAFGICLASIDYKLCCSV